jgi:hypothetical protein
MSIVEIRQCHHLYHRSCLLEWLGRHASCPLCRTDVLGE